MSAADELRAQFAKNKNNEKEKGKLDESSTSTVQKAVNLLNFIKSVEKGGKLKGAEKEKEAKKLIGLILSQMTEKRMEGMLIACKKLPFSNYKGQEKAISDLVKGYLDDTKSKANVADLATTKSLKKAVEFMDFVKDVSQRNDCDMSLLSWDAIARNDKVKDSITTYILDMVKVKSIGRGIAFYSKLTFMVVEFSIGMRIMLSIWKQNLAHYQAFGVPADKQDIPDLIEYMDTVEIVQDKKPDDARKTLVIDKAETFKEWLKSVQEMKTVSTNLYELITPSPMLLKQAFESRKNVDKTTDGKIALLMYSFQLFAFENTTEITSLSKDDNGVRKFFEAYKKITFCLRYATKKKYGSSTGAQKKIRTLQTFSVQAGGDFTL